MPSSQYYPLSYQMAVHEAPERFRVVVWHRRAGKSTLAVNEILKHAYDEPGRYWAVLPSYRQAKTVLWPLLLQYTPEDWIYKANESSLELRLKNGSEIALKGAENRDSLRGVGLRGVVMDEYAFMQRDVWSEIILPSLADHKGWALFIGTPYTAGDHFHQIYQYGQSEDHKEWKSWHLSALESGIIEKHELERIKAETPQSIWEREWLAKFLEGTGTVFRRFRENATAKEVPAQAGHLYRVGIDLARLHNWTVLSVVDRHTFEQVYFERFQQLDWPLQKAKIEATALRYNNAEIVIDSTGVGDAVTQELHRVGLNLWVDEKGRPGFKYTGEKKKVLVENLAKMLEQDRLKLIPVPVQLQELESFTFFLPQDARASTQENRYQYGAPQGMTEDCVNALALSVWDIGDQLPMPTRDWREPETYYESPYEA